jgi:cytochrome c oxidase subunit 2
MKLWEIVALFVVIGAIALPVTLPYLDNTFMPEKGEANTIVIRAYIKEAGGFQPEVIKVKKGEKVRIVVEGMDVVHGFAIKGLGIDLGAIEVGEKKVVEFVAEKEGVYVFKCTVMCSPQHNFMKGIIIVEGE